ncbi:hypothetical protein SUVZ_08G1350 [Saccharomyces uvarum]|uniref:Nup1p n=1 Tax=Saccharomyces uvarum TaxID=230603 RepID=A0ABN8WXS1_SACUV|nr:hypothetical protein SUVZ_08G1350 [Saccharomyces uvarum]
MTASTSSVMSSPREGKRSFSSTIKSLFLNSNKKRLSNKKSFNSDIAYTNHLDDSDPESTLHVKKRKRMAGTSQHNDRIVQDNSSVPIIIYGAEGTERPPVLPILPIQRLRLLREKQKLRNMRDHRLLQASRVPSVSSSMFLDPQEKADDKESYIRTSTTPSPIKKAAYTGEGGDNTGIKLPVLRSLKNKANREKFQSHSKGIVWSADFEYDLSEYDTMQKQQNNKNIITTSTGENKTETSNNDNKNNDVNGNLAENSISASNFEDLRSDINSSRLSNSQKDLLLNGSTSIVTKHATVPKDSAVTIKPLDTPTLKKIAESKKDKESIVLPTIGFDFIKDNETPSKKTSPVANGSTDTVVKLNSARSDIGKPANIAEIPKLSFNIGQKTNEPKITEQSASSSPLFNFGGKPDAASSIKKPFSFGKVTEREEMPMKPQAPAFSFSKPGALSDTIPKSTAAAFSFGKHEKNDEQDGDDDDDDGDANEPKRKRRTQTSEPVNAKSLFSLDYKGEANKVEQKNSTSENPSFAFGSSNKQVESGPSFAFGKKPDENDQTKSPIAFTFGKPVVAKGPEAKSSETLTSASGKPNFTFGQSISENSSEASAKPAFSFSKSAKQPESDSTSNSADKPLFSFGGKPADIQALPDDTTSKPTFSFSKTAQENSSVASDSKMPSFAFGASSNPSQQKSLFSFGKPDAAKEPADSKSSFTFTKPSIEKTDTKGAPSFTFGAPATNPIADNNTKPSFSFGVPKPIVPSAVMTAGSTDKTSGGFSFSKFDDKKENSATPTPLFKRSASTTPVSTMGKPIGSNNTTSKSAFSFGTANTEATNAAPSSTSFSFNAPNTGNITTNTISSTSGTNIVGGFNLGKRAQSSDGNSDTNGGGSRFSLARPENTANSMTSDQSSFNFGSNSTAGPNPFTSAAPSNNTGLFNKPLSMGAQNTDAPSSFNFTGNNPTSGSVFNMNNNPSATTMFGGSNTNLSQQSQNTSFNTNNSFTPSTVPNIHFGGFDGGTTNSAAGALKPSDIFGGNSASGSNVNGINPSSVFGGSGGAPSFGQPQTAPNQMGINTGMNMGMNPVGNGGMTNRKIARMRHTKR